MSEDTPALLQIVRGNPDPAQIAALVAVLLSLPTATPSGAGRAAGWSSPAAAVRRELRAGPRQWRASALP